jgi:putative sigma-54 modulation protein
MEIIVSARHTSLTDAMKDAVTERLEAMEKHSHLTLTKAEAVLSVERKVNSVNIVLHGNHVNLDAKAEGRDMYVVIHEAVDKLERQLEKRAAHVIKR